MKREGGREVQRLPLQRSGRIASHPTSGLTWEVYWKRKGTEMGAEKGQRGRRGVEISPWGQEWRKRKRWEVSKAAFYMETIATVHGG